MATDVSGVFISHERLKALEKLEEELPELLSKTAEEAIKKHTKSKLEGLNARAKADPKGHSECAVLDYYGCL